MSRMQIPSSENLEARIREAEQKLGIRPGDGVSISYERGSETVGSFIYLALVGLIFAFFLRGMGNIRASIQKAGGLNPFSKITKADFTLIDPQIRSELEIN